MMRYLAPLYFAVFLSFISFIELMEETLVLSTHRELYQVTASCRFNTSHIHTVDRACITYHISPSSFPSFFSQTIPPCNSWISNKLLMIVQTRPSRACNQCMFLVDHLASVDDGNEPET